MYFPGEKLLERLTTQGTTSLVKRKHNYCHYIRRRPHSNDRGKAANRIPQALVWSGQQVKSLMLWWKATLTETRSSGLEERNLRRQIVTVTRYLGVQLNEKRNFLVHVENNATNTTAAQDTAAVC